MNSRWVALALMFVTRTSMGFQFQSIGSLAPLVVADLGLSYAQLGTLIGLYLLPGVVLALPGGLIGQRVGDRRAVVASLALMVVGGLLTAWSDSFAGAAAGRLVSGGGSVLMNILLIKITADWFAGREMATAMAVILTAWPVGLGLATATLGSVAMATSWRTAMVVAAVSAALGLIIMAVVFREAPVRAAPGARAAPDRRDLGLAITSGVAWGAFNASLVGVIAFGPAMLVARGLSLGQAGFEISLAIWVTIVSVPLGGVLSDRVGRPDVFSIGGALAAGALLLALPMMPWAALGLVLVGMLIGGPPGPLTSMLPRALAPERLATGLGVSYTAYYVVMAAAQPLAGWLRDVTGDPATPIRFAAAAMAATIAGVVAFRVIEHRADVTTTAPRA
ncbi:MAG: arabinose ABC transporter permease [Candidatus Rokuibacteriota bacterium]|nr:MAG: arabinose ABC transporter permease [Candidatus Rokubacteria bacterium]